MGMLWFDRPAGSWSEALPIGNGRLGAMVFGGGKSETLQLNQDSVWYGGPIDRINPDAKSHLEEVRKLILGKFRRRRTFSAILFPARPEGNVPIRRWGIWN